MHWLQYINKYSQNSFICNLASYIMAVFTVTQKIMVGNFTTCANSPFSLIWNMGFPKALSSSLYRRFGLCELGCYFILVQAEYCRERERKQDRDALNKLWFIFPSMGHKMVALGRQCVYILQGVLQLTHQDISLTFKLLYHIVPFFFNGNFVACENFRLLFQNQ